MKIKKIVAFGLSALMAVSLCGGSVSAADFTDQAVAYEADDSAHQSQFYKGVYYSWRENDTKDGVILYSAWNTAGFPEVIELPATREIDGKELPVVGLAADIFNIRGNGTVRNVVVPDTVTTIGEGAFESCKNLESIVLSKRLQEIYRGAFHNCSKLKSIVLPNTIQKIGISAFEGCSSLSSVTLGTGLREIGIWAFNDCPSLKSITIPANVTYIGAKAFGSTPITVYGYSGSAAEEEYAGKSGNVTFVLLDKKTNGVTIKASDKTMTASASKSQSWTIGAKASNGAKLTYKSNNAKVKVSSSGKVTVPKKFVGTVKITIKTKKTSKVVTLTVKKASNPLKVRTKNQKIKASAVKKKAKTFKVKVTKAQGKVSYKSSKPKYVTVSAKGKVTIKKGTPKGKYKITVTAKGKGIYNKKSKTITITVK